MNVAYGTFECIDTTEVGQLMVVSHSNHFFIAINMVCILLKLCHVTDDREQKACGHCWIKLQNMFHS